MGASEAEIAANAELYRKSVQETVAVFGVDPAKVLWRDGVCAWCCADGVRCRV